VGYPRDRRNQTRHIGKDRISRQGWRRNTESQWRLHQNPGHQKKPVRRKEGNERNRTGTMSMEGRPLIVPRKDLDTKRRRTTNNSYHKTPPLPTTRTGWNGKNYRTPQSTIILAKDKKRYQTIHNILGHMSENQDGPTGTLRNITVKWGPWSTVEINSDGLHYRAAESQTVMTLFGWSRSGWPKCTIWFPARRTYTHRRSAISSWKTESGYTDFHERLSATGAH